MAVTRDEDLSVELLAQLRASDTCASSGQFFGAFDRVVGDVSEELNSDKSGLLDPVKVVSTLVGLGMSLDIAQRLASEYYNLASARFGSTTPVRRGKSELRREKWLVEMNALAEEPGLCYLNVVKHSARAYMLRKLGYYPSFRSLLEHLEPVNFWSEAADRFKVYRLSPRFPGDHTVRYHIASDSDGLALGSFAEVVVAYAKLYPMVAVGVVPKVQTQLSVLPMVGTVGGDSSAVAMTSLELLSNVSRGYGGSFLFPRGFSASAPTHGPFVSSLTVVVVRGQAVVSDSTHSVAVDGYVVFGVYAGGALAIERRRPGTVVEVLSVPDVDLMSWREHFGVVDGYGKLLVDESYPGLVASTFPLVGARRVFNGDVVMMRGDSVALTDSGTGSVELTASSGVDAMSHDWRVVSPRKVLFVGEPGAVSVKCVASVPGATLRVTAFPRLIHDSLSVSPVETVPVVLDGYDANVPADLESTPISPLVDMAFTSDVEASVGTAGVTHVMMVLPQDRGFPLDSSSGYTPVVAPDSSKWWFLRVPPMTGVVIHGAVVKYVPATLVFLVPPSVTVYVEDTGHDVVPVSSRVVDMWMDYLHPGLRLGTYTRVYASGQLAVVLCVSSFRSYGGRGFHSLDYSSLDCHRLIDTAIPGTEIHVHDRYCVLVG